MNRLAGMAAAMGLALVWCNGLPRAGAQEAAAPLTFRRIFVPEDALAGQIRGLWPLKREEFERRLKTAEGLRIAASPAQVRIEAAAWRARYEPGRLAEGLARLDIRLDSARPAILPLSPCSVALESARWAGDERRPAIVGVDPSGGLVCVVERSGSLELKWSQHGQPATEHEATFDLLLPAAGRCRLEIEAPGDLRLESQAGLTAGAELLAGQADRRLWAFELGGGSQTRLSVRRDKPAGDQSLVIVRESSSYSVLAASVDLETTLTLDVLRQPLTGLVLQADPGLKITAIRLADQPLDWSLLEGPPEAGPQRLAVALAGPLQGIARSLQITATADWPAAGRWPLPRIHVAGGIWQEGRATIAAPAWLRLEVQPLTGCERTAVAAAAAGRAGDQFQFQLFAADAAIEVAADPRPAQLRERSGTEIRIDGSQVSGVLIAELSSLGGERFSVEAVVPRHWLIDAVETQPADMLADRTTTPRGGGQQTLRLNLTRSLNETRPLRLTVRAHFRRPALERPLDEDFFRLATFPDAREGRRLTAVRVADPTTELRLSGDEQLARLAPGDLTPAELRLFETPPSGLLFEAGDAAEALRGQLAQTAPRYRAEVLVQAHAQRDHVRQTVSIRCQPQAAVVQSLLVRLAPRPVGGVSWRLVGEETRELTHAPVVEPAVAGGDDAVYRLTLARPRSSPFEVRGELTAAGSANGGHEVSVAWLPEASAQVGLIEVDAPQGGALSVTGREVERLPAPARVPERFTPLVARFRYEAGRRAGVRVAPAGRASQPAAWVESLGLASRFSFAGEGDHEATLKIVNAGLYELRLRLPPQVANLRLSDESAGGTLTRTAAGGAVIALPAHQRHAEVRLRYSTSTLPLGMAPLGQFAAPVPQLDLPIFSQTWNVALAPGLTALSAPIVIESAGARPDAAWAGWTQYRPALSAGSEARLTIYRPALFQAWALCLGLAAAALAVVSRRPASKLLPLAGLCCAASLLLAAPWSWLLLAAALGLAAGGIAGLVRPRRESHAAAETGPPGSTIVLAAGQGSGAVLLALVLAQARPMAAAQPAASPKYWRVVVPVDEDQQPVGDYVFLEPELYEALHKLTAAGPAALPTWLLESARYELPAAPHAGEDRAAIDELRVQLDFHTFQPAATLALPLRREQVSLVEGRARLDGQPLALDWSDDGAALKLAAGAPGRHRLELTLGAGLRREAGSWLLDLAIPPAARTTLVLPASGAEAVTTAGTPIPSDGNGARAIFLGAASGLRVRWPETALTPGAAATGEVEQLLWWRIRPGSVLVEGRFLIRPASAPVRELLLAVDPRLRLVSPPGSTPGGPVSRVAPLAGSPDVVRVELAEPASRELAVKLSWLWTDAGGVGALTLPSIAVLEQRIRRTLVAATVEPAFTAQWEPAPQAAPPPTAGEFLASWGESPLAPTLVQGAPPASQPLTLRVQPQPAEPQAKQTVDWSLSSTAAAARLSIKLTGVGASRLAHRLTLPPQLKVHTVTLEQGGRLAQIRWSQQADGLLAVQLLEASAPEQWLTVAAELPLSPQRQRMQLPALRLAQAALGASQMRIFRREDVRLALIDPAGWTRQDDPQLGQYVPGLGRLVAALASGSSIGDTQPRVSRSANRPRLSGSLLIRVQEDDDDWLAEARLDLAVSGGLVDEAWLSIPAEWSERLTIQPSAGGELANVPEHQILPIPGESRRHLLIRPLKAAQDRLQWTIRGPLASGPAGMEAPDVTLLGDALAGEAAVQRLVLLDTRAGAERIEWETTGLQAVPLDDAALPAEWRAAGGEALRVVAPRFSAKARVRASTAAAPQVMLAEVAVQLGADRHAAVTSNFTIQPNGAAEVAFTLPPGWRLVQAQLDGVLAEAAPAGLRTWRLAAPTKSLPYRLTVVTDGRLAADGVAKGRFALAAPQLVGLAPTATAWKIDGGRYRTLAAGGRPLPAASAAELALLRLEVAAAGLEDLATAVASELPSAEQAESFRAWWRDYLSAAARLDAAPQAAPAEWTARRQGAAQNAERARQRMLAGGVLMENDLPLATAAPPAGMDAKVCFLSPSAAGEIVLLAPPVRPPQSAAPLAALLAAVSASLFVVLPLPRVRGWLEAHAGLIVAAAGIGWWLMAPWGVAGWLLVFAAVWLALRWSWPRGYQPSAASW